MSLLTLDSGRVYYEDMPNERGRADAPVLVLGHAAFLDRRMWDAQIASFREHFRVICYDMLGYGRSDAVTGSRERRAHLLALLDHLGVPRAHLIGASMSGEIALDLALEHPERVASVITIKHPERICARRCTSTLSDGDDRGDAACRL